MRKKIVGSIIAESQEELEERMSTLNGITSTIQLDVMDGKFVNQHSMNFDFKMPKTDAKIEAHLMTKSPESWLKSHGRGVDTIIAHVESCKDPEHMLNLISKQGKAPGLALNPETPVSSIIGYLDKMRQVLVMTVHPGKYGSKFLPKTLEKVKELRELAPHLNIEVDGGMTPAHIKRASKAGANLFVSGSYLQKSKDIKKSIQTLRGATK